MAAVASADDAHGGFDLDAEDAAVVFDHQIVAGGVSPGLGDHDAVFGDASHETKLGPFAAEFAVRDKTAGGGRRFGLGFWHLCPSWKKARRPVVNPAPAPFFLPIYSLTSGSGEMGHVRWRFIWLACSGMRAIV